MAARDRELGDRHDPAARPGRGRSAAGQRRAGRRRRRRSSRRRRPTPPADRRAPGGTRTAGAVAEAGVRGRRPGPRALRTRAPSRIDQLGQAALGRPVAGERAVPVEVVGGHVRVDRDRRAARQRRQLELGELDDDAMVRRQLGQPLDERDADVPAEHDRVRRVGGEDARRSARRSSSCPSSRSPRSSAPGTGAGTGPARETRAGAVPSPPRGGHRRAPGAPPAGAARSSGSPG